MNIDSRIKKINGNLLKIVACISMLVDHMAAGVMLPVVRYRVYNGSLSIDQLNDIYKFLRKFGRTAFPIYCFLLVEGFFHTKSRRKYALSLLIFGLISEIPFDISLFAEKEVFNPNLLEVVKANSFLLMDQCNVYATLFVGLLTIWCLDFITNYVREKNLSDVIAYWLYIPTIALGCLICIKANTDYDAYGILLISIFYLLYKHDYLRLIAAYLFISQLSIEYAAFPGFILMALYNKKRGRNLGKFKYFFYLFYPLHLLAIHFIRCMMYSAAY
ncbi:TraX family protein [Butyrivibrio sp. YAB3001]|uniref:TraX family protein n=1 Tax=Butyrivibrio sp. YAB3001 TaxID=1520812 RepID=UPI0008F62E99|nr:TraX family protein [Butyrivibrio sp. YAB3001]SFB76344.1 TraX protein [Butyrivibrio sp. YAB3001]